MSILENINSAEDLKALPAGKLPALCGEIRSFLISTLARTGGHLASNLGAVELTVALDRVYDPMTDRICFDVGHQAYTHKLLTGRRDRFDSLRRFGGLSGFPKPCESGADAFVAGHASDSVSVALGMARARTALGEGYDVCAVIGDGALTGGLAYEGLCAAGASREPMVVVLNDNTMSINSSVGGAARLLSALRVKPGYFSFKRGYRRTVGRIKPLYNALHAVKEAVKGAILPDNMFDDLGFYYLGPVDGHDVPELESAIRWAREMRVPVLLHVLTKKGKGCPFAEAEPEKYHGVGPFDPGTGAMSPPEESFSDVFGETMCALAAEDDTVAAVTAAMCGGTGLTEFAKRFPRRFFDVGIAEGSAVSMCAGMAKQGLKPVAAIYSTFLQRSYDMLIHDVALLGLHVVLGVDRAGLSGPDGETHQGAFDVSYLSGVPGMEIWSPASFEEVRVMLRRAVLYGDGPVAVRYPRGGQGEYVECHEEPAAVLRSGTDVTLVTYGVLINSVLQAARLLEAQGVSAQVIKLGRVAPLDPGPVLESLERTGRLVVAEESCAAGCVGERLLAAAAGRLSFKSALVNLGSGIVPHGRVEELYELLGLDGAGIAKKAEGLMR